MSNNLKEYNKKRNFANTPEPKGNSREPGDGNRFVIQRHMARREHYDFRLQVGNVLVSWAIPKKPVIDPEVKRLAVKTEDHPLDYIHFEGVIPEGNYGAGTVMVWDYGFYYSEKDRSVLKEEDLHEMLEKGKLKVHLQGVKIKGSFNLVKIRKSKKDEWLFMKASEKEESDDDEKSALTGRSMEEITRGNKSHDQNIKNSKENSREEKENTGFAEKTDFPGFIFPMLATPVENAFSDEEWIFEFKLDGYRIISVKNSDDVDLYSRNGNDYNKKYSLIRDELKELKANFVLDGEVCYMVNGRPDFQKLQNNYSQKDKVHYYAFDLLWVNGHDLKKLPLIKRKELLKELLSNSGPHVHYLDHIEKEGKKFFREIEEKNLEGIIAKRKDSTYHPSWRSNEWLKIKTLYRQEMVICGYTESEKDDREFKSILCAVSFNHKYIYTGKVGTGFNQEKQKQIMHLLSDLTTDKPPVENPPNDQNVIWVKPELVCEIKFSEWTVDKVMRHPSFIALREDKSPEQVKIQRSRKAPVKNRKIALSNPDKIFWPEEKIRKRDVYGYYESIAEIILPYLKDRPQSLYRTPDGIQKKGFFQKDMEDLAPAWAKTITVERIKDNDIEYLLCQDIDTLLFMVNLGCIEINPWNAVVTDLNHPDLMVFDLDPLDIEFSAVVNVAIEFIQLFDKLEIPSFCKTSGGRGLHLYVPIEPTNTHRQIQNFARILMVHVHKKTRKITSLERSPSKRKRKIYLDYLQNGKGKTMASVYSLRPRKGAPVSTPIRMKELNNHLDPFDFNIHTLPGRIEMEGDIWEGLFDSRIDLKKKIDRMAGG
ncbi:MAG: DNA ligase D [Bacteroidota bacterium]